VRDIRNIGLMGAVELHPRADGAGLRGQEVFARCFALGALVRYTGDTIALSPPLIIERAQVDRLAETLRRALRETR
jgi:beta-alanine--pyruvate transaminase